MSVLFGRTQPRSRRSALGTGAFGWGPGRADFSASSIVPPPGQAPDLSGTEASLQKVAVWATVALATAAAESLPGDVYSGEGSDKRSRRMPSWLDDLSGQGFGLPDWIAQFMFSGMLRGNVTGLIAERDRTTGQPRQIVPTHPDYTSAFRDSDGELKWRVGTVEYPAGEMWHKRVHPVPGMLMGLSPIGLHTKTIGLGISALQYGSNWFQHGAVPSALLTTDAQLDASKAREAKARWMAANGKREPAVLGNGWKYQQIQIAPEESQFLETHKLTSAECCRIFGPAYAEVLGYETGGTMTYSNREQRSLDLLVYSVDPWLVRIERALTALLPQPQYFKFNRGALLRTDLLTRFRAHNIAIISEFETRDEVRAIEDYAPLTAEQKAEFDSIRKSGPPGIAIDQNGAKE